MSLVLAHHHIPKVEGGRKDNMMLTRSLDPVCVAHTLYLLSTVPFPYVCAVVEDCLEYYVSSHLPP